MTAALVSGKQISMQRTDTAPSTQTQFVILNYMLLLADVTAHNLTGYPLMRGISWHSFYLSVLSMHDDH